MLVSRRNAYPDTCVWVNSTFSHDYNEIDEFIVFVPAYILHSVYTHARTHTHYVHD